MKLGCGTLVILLAVFLVIVFGFWDGGSDSPTERSPYYSSSLSPQQQLLALPEHEQQDYLGQVIVSTEGSCSPTLSEHQFTREGIAYFYVKCSDGQDYSVTVDSDANGTTGVMSCGIARLGGVKCRIKD